MSIEWLFGEPIRWVFWTLGGSYIPISEKSTPSSPILGCILWSMWHIFFPYICDLIIDSRWNPGEIIKMARKFCILFCDFIWLSLSISFNVLYRLIKAWNEPSKKINLYALFNFMKFLQPFSIWHRLKWGVYNTNYIITEDEVVW